jgi:CRP-like cAMP-binding protein
LENPTKICKTPSDSPLVCFFNQVHPISKEAADYINKETYVIQVAKGKWLVKPGTPNNNLYLVLKGVVRGYMKQNNKEITTWLTEENEMVGPISNLGLNNQAATEYVQVIEEATLVVVPSKCLEYMYSNFAESNIIGRKILEESYRSAEQRAFICRLPSADKKYKHFLLSQPALVNRISLKYIASYLGMTIETLSRIRSRMR